MGLALSPPRKGLVGKSDKLRAKEISKTSKKWGKDVRKARKSKKAEDATVGFKSEAAFKRHEKTLSKIVSQGKKEIKGIMKAGEEDERLLDMYGKKAMKARGLLRSATQKRAKKPVKKILPGKGGPTTYIPQQTSIGGLNARGGSIKKKYARGSGIRKTKKGKK